MHRPGEGGGAPAEGPAQTCGGRAAHPLPTWECAPPNPPLEGSPAAPFMNMHREPALPSPPPCATPPQRRHLSLLVNRLLLWTGLQNFNDLQNIVNYVKRHLLHIFM